jgi:DNA polymerase
MKSSNEILQRLNPSVKNYLLYCEELLGQEGGIFYREALLQALEGSVGRTEGSPSSLTMTEIEEEFREVFEGKLLQGANQFVFGEGHESAEIVFIGEAPGAEEDKQGRPFVGKAGQLLDKMIKAMGLSRSDVYITNVVKCRPPKNRTPLPEEISEYMPTLKKQLRAIRPRVLVALGGVSAKALLKSQRGIASMRGEFKYLSSEFFDDEATDELFTKIRVMPTFHPAYLLRNPSEKRKVWLDLQKVMGVCGLK